MDGKTSPSTSQTWLAKLTGQLAPRLSPTLSPHYLAPLVMPGCEGRGRSGTAVGPHDDERRPGLRLAVTGLQRRFLACPLEHRIERRDEGRRREESGAASKSTQMGDEAVEGTAMEGFVVTSHAQKGLRCRRCSLAPTGLRRRHRSSRRSPPAPLPSLSAAETTARSAPVVVRRPRRSRLRRLHPHAAPVVVHRRRSLAPTGHRRPCHPCRRSPPALLPPAPHPSPRRSRPRPPSSLARSHRPPPPAPLPSSFAARATPTGAASIPTLLPSSSAARAALAGAAFIPAPLPPAPPPSLCCSRCSLWRRLHPSTEL